MKRRAQQGFTLIELLTVIAIIGILASITYVGVGRILERGRMTKVIGTVETIQSALMEYYTDNNSFPPPYGSVTWDARDAAFGSLPDSQMYHLRPLYSYLNFHNSEDHADYMSVGFGYDANQPANGIGILEFSPIGSTNVATGQISFPTERYTGGNLSGEVNQQSSASSRPFIYLAYNERQFKKAKRYFVERRLYQAEAWDANDQYLANMAFPPPTYDKVVLVSVGPNADTFGVIPEPLGSENPKDLYHITALRAAFLATRDLNANGLKDFDFIARTQKDEGAQVYDINGVDPSSYLPFPEAPTNQLPSSTSPNGAGPMIFEF